MTTDLSGWADTPGLAACVDDMSEVVAVLEEVKVSELISLLESPEANNKIFQYNNS